MPGAWALRVILARIDVIGVEEAASSEDPLCQRGEPEQYEARNAGEGQSDHMSTKPTRNYGGVVAPPR